MDAGEYDGVSDEEWLRSFDVNVHSFCRVTEAALGTSRTRRGDHPAIPATMDEEPPAARWGPGHATFPIQVGPWHRQLQVCSTQLAG